MADNYIQQLETIWKTIDLINTFLLQKKTMKSSIQIVSHPKKGFQRLLIDGNRICTMLKIWRIQIL